MANKNINDNNYYFYYNDRDALYYLLIDLHIKNEPTFYEK